ncbi:MAG TPA: hypothetical protein VD906_10795 [Caulobacteraceae bacterium]|nr:hypothetical protein [Caulobacteraceae bacterium]
MGRRHLDIVALAAAALIAPLAALAADAPTDRAAQTSAAAERGELIYRLDQAAWVATDALLKDIADPQARGVAGWIVTEEADGLRVIFYSDSDVPAAVYTAQVRDGKVVSARLVEAGEDARLSESEVRMVRARQAASRQKVTPCTAAAMNTVVIPPSADEERVEVYLMSSQVKAKEYPFGGHYLYAIAPDGEVVSRRPFTKGCLNLSTVAPDGKGTVAGMVLTHYLDPHPTEIHVFVSRRSGLPVYVMTPPADAKQADEAPLWYVRGKSIELARPGD